MKYKVTKTVSIHMIFLEATNGEIEQAIEKLKHFKCYSKSSDLTFTLYIDKLELYIYMNEDTLLQTMMKTDNNYTAHFITYNDRSSIGVSLYLD